MKKELSTREFLEKSRNRCAVLADFNRCLECKAYDNKHICTLCGSTGLLEENEIDEVIKQIEEWEVTEPKEPPVKIVTKKEKRKKVILALQEIAVTLFCIIGALGCIGFFVFIGCNLKKRDFDYSTKGIVKNHKTIITEDGNIWKYDTTIKKGTKVIVKFHNNNTESIYDDIIQEVKEKN